MPSKAKPSAVEPEVVDQAHKASMGGSLLQSLLLVARTHGTTITADAVLAGLPLQGGELNPALFERAARRAGLSSRILEKPLTRIQTELLPAILLLDDHQTCVVMSLDTKAAQATVAFPDLGEAAVAVPLQELAQRYTGWVIYARPQMRFDERSDAVKQEHGQHWFWGVIAENRKLYRDVLVAAVVINLFAVAMPLYVLNVYDRVVPNHAAETLWVLTIGILTILVADLILRIMRGYFVDLAASRIDVKVSANLMERVMGMRMIARPPSAGSFAANLGAFEAVRNFVGSATVTALVDLPFVLLFILVIALIAWPAAIPVVIGAAIVLLYALAVQRRMHDLAITMHRATARRNASLVENLVGLETIKSFNAEGRAQRIWESATAYITRHAAQQRLLSTSVTTVATWGQHTVGVSVIVVGVYLIMQGGISQGALIATYLLSSRAMAPISRAASLLAQYHQSEAALDSLDRVMEKPVERPAGSNFISRPTFQGKIEFREVGFQYPGEDQHALNGVSFTLEPGEHVAILGRIGSGKTTLERLIMGLYQPTSGSVRIDDIDIRQIDPAELRRHIGYVPQDVTLFYGTLLENITMAAPHADSAKILQAVRVSGLDAFVKSHPRGLSMQVGERGETLSGGQRQSVAIARAVINDPPILVFDEPTASMDHSTEEAAKGHLARVAAGKTMIIVTHRMSILELVDRVIVMDTGKIVADGPKAQVVTALRQGRIGKVQ